VFENKVLRRMFGPKRDDVTGGWRKLHNEELLYLNASPTIIRMIKSKRMKWERHVTRMGEKRNAHRILVGKREGNIPLGRPRRRWLDNTETYLRELGSGGMDRVGLAQDRDQFKALVNKGINLWVP
jgi:hypothetical protein